MQKRKIKIKEKQGGITLIEVMIFIALLSILMSSFIQYAYVVSLQNFKLINDVNDAQYI